MAPRIKREELRVMFQAIVDYHNKLAMTRFTIAGLFIAATSFLANSWFDGLPHPNAYPAVPLLGIFFSLVCMILEARTYRLLGHLGKRGLSIENKLLNERQPEHGFFALMAHQPSQSIVSHSIGLALLYVSIALFWILVLLFGRTA